MSLENYYQYRLSGSAFSFTSTIRLASEIFGLSPSTISYWRKKLKIPFFHSQKHGGRRYVKSNRKIKFTSLEKVKIKTIIWLLVKYDSTQKLSTYKNVLFLFGYECSKEYVRKIFKAWRWSWKRPLYHQIQKYSIKNLDYYGNFLTWISTISNWNSLKFMDEVHFVSKVSFF